MIQYPRLSTNFDLYATISRQQRQLKEYLGPRRPQMAAHHPREYQWATEPFGSIIRDPLHEVMVMRVGAPCRLLFMRALTVPCPQLCDQSHACVDQLLTALWHAEYHGRYGLYRTAVILLADVGLEFGMTRWCRRILDEVMPQIMSEGDKEQTAFAQYTLARCIIAAENTSRTLFNFRSDLRVWNLKFEQSPHSRLRSHSLMRLHGRTRTWR